MVVFFHDRDIVRHGAAWFGRHLDQWRAAGATRFVDFRQLAAELALRIAVDDTGDPLRVVVEGGASLAPVAPIEVWLRVPGRALPASVTVICGDRESSVAVEPSGDGIGRIRLAAPAR